MCTRPTCERTCDGAIEIKFDKNHTVAAAQISESINFLDLLQMHRPHVHRRRGRAFRLAVIAHSTLRSMLLRTKHYVTDCRLVATHVLSADVRYRWRPLPSACTRDEKLHTHPETMNFAFSMFVAFTAFYLYFVSGLLLLPLRVCRRLHHNNGFLFAISRFLELI